MRVLVCGGRDYDNKPRVYEVLDRIHAEHTIGLLICGDAKGADALARRWCTKHGIPLAVFPPAWGKLRKTAGPIRNTWMLKFMKPHLVVAFPGGRGTQNMLTQSEEAGAKIERIDQNSNQETQEEWWL